MASGGVRSLLFVINSLAAGGGESHMVYLARGLAEAGFDVTVVSIASPAGRDLSALRDVGVRLLTLRADSRETKVARLPALIRLARKADVVCSSLFDATLYGRIAAIVARRPAVTIEHTPGRELSRAKGGESRKTWAELHNRLLDPFTFAVIATAHWQVPMLRDEGVSEDKLSVIHNGVTIDEIRRGAATGVSRADLGVPEDAKLLIHVARFAPQKNQPATLEVVRRLRRDLGDVHVLFAGGGQLRAEVEARAASMGAAGWAHFIGQRGDVPRLLRLADVFVLPSSAEAMPLSILEALAVGVPVVSTDIADIRRILETSGGGIVIPPGDDDAYEAALRRLLSDDDLREDYAAAAARGGREHFDYSRMAERYATVLTAAADSRADTAETRVSTVVPIG